MLAHCCCIAHLHMKGATLMGTAVGVLMLFTGYPLGIAGLYREAMAPTTTDRGMRVAFIAGGLMASLFLRYGSE